MPVPAALVPPEVLQPPDAFASRGFDRHDAALVLDHHLRRLAVQDGRGRMVLGRLAAAFLRRRGREALGFARLDDYARERLGMSGREVESLAGVARRLTRLPEVAAAFAQGELSWAHLRLLVRVAEPDSQERWLALARGRTVRALEALIRVESPDPDEENSPTARFSLPCPPRVLLLWHRAVELARRMAGASLSHGDAAEAIAAEGLSGRPPGCDTWVPNPSPPVPMGDPDETRAAFAPDLDWSAVAEALPSDLDACAIGCEHLDASALDARMRVVVTGLQQAAWQTGRLLRLFLDRRLFLLMGFRSASHYLRERLGLSERTARVLVAVERKTWHAPAFGDAYRSGELSRTQALMLLPVVTDATAAAWVERAQQVTARRLDDEVGWALAVRVPCDPVLPPVLGAPLALPERQMCTGGDWELTDAKLTFRAPAEVVGLFRAAVVAFTERAEPLWRGLERLLLHVIAEWEAQPRHRDPIFARDGWRCAVPACSGRRNLHDHHVLFRSRGGDNTRDNRVTVCAWHHLRGIHAGVVRAWGAAPDGLTWELGVRTGKRPLLRCAAGDVYLAT